MKINIPDVGARLILEQDWSFRLVLENRNNSIIEKFFPNYHSEYSYKVWQGDNLNSVIKTKELEEQLDKIHKSRKRDWQELYRACLKENTDKLILEKDLPPIVFLKGTELTIDRVYIRKGNNDFSSISFWALLPGERKKLRMFAKLADVNNIEYK